MTFFSLIDDRDLPVLWSPTRLKFLLWNSLKYDAWCGQLSIKDSGVVLSGKCKNDPDKFCYICGDITFKTQRRNLTPLVIKLYEEYYGFAIRQRDKMWVSHIFCVNLLNGRAKRSRSKSFAIPMQPNEPLIWLLVSSYLYKRY